MRPCLSLLALLTLGLLLPAFAAESPSSAEEIWADHVEALGGWKALEAVQTRIVHGRYLEDLSWKEPRESSAAISAYHWWDMTTVLSFTREGTLHEFWNGPERWLREKDGWKRRDGGELPPRWWADPRLLARADAICDRWEPQPAGSSPGRRVLTGIDDSGKVRTAEFDRDSGLLRRLDHWTFEEYRKAGDVLMPARIEESRKGGSSVWLADCVEQDVALPPELLGS